MWIPCPAPCPPCAVWASCRSSIEPSESGPASDMGAAPGAPPPSWPFAAPATTGASFPSAPSAYLRCQKSSTERTTGISSKFHGGGGEEVAHSRVRASHGSAPAASGSRKLRTTLYRKIRIDAAIMKAPMVETKFQKFHPWYDGYV